MWSPTSSGAVTTNHTYTSSNKQLHGASPCHRHKLPRLSLHRPIAPLTKLPHSHPLFADHRQACSHLSVTKLTYKWKPPSTHSAHGAGQGHAELDWGKDNRSRGVDHTMKGRRWMLRAKSSTQSNEVLSVRGVNQLERLWNLGGEGSDKFSWENCFIALKDHEIYKIPPKELHYIKYHRKMELLLESSILSGWR
jgi:hypothetical protein